ncbi:MAG: helix-turn-helix transcriptional regulator [Coleofasciculus sp. Co-bin14]|nr:helix-turn-helix transcriptional regulator [Coleofasciculus sp. Co-bin14]
MRQFAPKVGVSYSAWGAWERETGNLGIETAEKLAAYIGTTVEQLQIYLNGAISLQEFLRSPLTLSEVNQSKSTDETVTTLAQVLIWMNSLDLPDLVRIASKAARLMEERVFKDFKQFEQTTDTIDTMNTTETVTIAALVQNELARRNCNEQQLASAAAISTTRLQAIMTGEEPDNEELIALGSVLHKPDGTLWKTLELIAIKAQTFGNGYTNEQEAT